MLETAETADSYEVLRMPSTFMENGYEIVDTVTMAMTQRFLACLDNDQMTDVRLVGMDGIEVPGCKFILGSASPNLQALLYSGKESKSMVRIPNVRAKALKALVEYSCSDMLNTGIWSDTEPVEIVEDMVSLAKLAELYTLPNLKQSVSDVLSPCLEQLPSLACVAYNLVDPKTTAELHASSLKVLRKKPYQAFVKGPGGEIGGIACLSPEKLDEIFSDSEVNAEEIFLFQCLQEWRNANEDEYVNTNQIARRVAQHLDFSAMNPSDIETIVLPSGIVDSQSLVNGLMTLAKAAEKKGIQLRSAKHKYYSKHPRAGQQQGESFSKSGTTATTITKASRGRRFKKTPIAGDQSSFASASGEEEARDDSYTVGTAPLPDTIHAPIQPPQPPTMTTTSENENKKSGIKKIGFRSAYFSAQALKATRFLGNLRGGIKEQPSQESEIVGGPGHLMPGPTSNSKSASKAGSMDKDTISHISQSKDTMSHKSKDNASRSKDSASRSKETFSHSNKDDESREPAQMESNLSDDDDVSMLSEQVASSFPVPSESK